MFEPFALFIGLLAGLTSALFGIGGAVIAIPLLYLGLGFTAQTAVGTAIFLVVLNSAIGAYKYNKRGLVNKKFALTAGVTGILFAIAGAWLTAGVKQSLVVYAVAFVTMAFAGLSFYGEQIKKMKWTNKVREKKRWASMLGAFVGLVNGFTGIGGGAALTSLLGSVFGLSVHAAVATSLATILFFSIPSALTHYSLGHTNVSVLLPLLVGAVIGSTIGVRVAMALKDNKLRAYTSIFFFLIGLWLAVSEYLKMSG
ncbi:sulfite exporter TauE/SafE family protein [Candidatus Micrarchaeota archaeon]|nr:sulfite exporter TauE/SafE family protein [Candidatus Micrarchaeota archaeon]